MLRRLCLIIVTVALVGSASSDLFACGDKFLRVGRSARFRRYATVHPSSILIYAPRWTDKGIKDFEAFLKKAGHKPKTVTTASAMSEAFTTAKYDVVITSYSTIADVRTEFEALPSRPVLVPVMYKATKAQQAEARRDYQSLIRPEAMTTFEAVEEIDRVLDARSKEIKVAAGPR